MIESEELARLRAEREALSRKIRVLEQKEREAASPFSVGQVIKWKHGRGFRRGTIKAFASGGEPIAAIILKSGAVSGTKTVYGWDDPKLDEVQSHG